MAPTADSSKQEARWGALFAAGTGVALLLQTWHALHWGQSRRIRAARAGR